MRRILGMLALGYAGSVPMGFLCSWIGGAWAIVAAVLYLATFGALYSWVFWRETRP